MLHKFIFTKTKAKVWIKLYLPEKNTFSLYIKTKWQNDKTTHSPLQKVQNNGTHRSRNAFKGAIFPRLRDASRLIAQFFTAAVNLIRQNTAGIMSFPFTETFYHRFAVIGFVVRSNEWCSIRVQPFVTLMSSLASNSNGFPAFPRTIGRIYGWLTLTMRSGTLCVRLPYIYFRWS